MSEQAERLTDSTERSSAKRERRAKREFRRAFVV